MENSSGNSSNNEVMIPKNLENIWPNALHHTNVLLDVLNSLDVICEMPYEINEENEVSEQPKYMIPWLSEPKLITAQILKILF
ncbi:hypothetical protein CEXT_470491 [Caerostris extrusa]|uniref:Uncharacterized protein n=1 Tax=Caerostris extrusa TaxID=172846 RepID=A0AAV4XCR5_CAEEX|nr:hypothetical protein CEXT_470491 [Caerostris extrusa]